MSCNSPTVIIGGVTLSTSDFVNAAELIDTVSGDQGDPTLDEYDENIANGNNTANRNGIQIPGNDETLATQTSLPTPSPIPASQVITSQGSTGNGVIPDIVVWTGDYDTYLSTNFKVRAFTVNAVFPYPLTEYDATYTAQVRFNNLRALSVNVAEPLRAKFGSFYINSGLRNKTSSSSTFSLHIKGQAMDIQFPGWTYARYWENAAWVKDNIPYDQFIFEHSDKTGLAWYHLSFNLDGNRSPTLSTKVMTMYRNHYDSGLRRYN